MKAAKIVGLIIVGGILGFLLRHISYNRQEPVADVDRKHVKPAKKAKRITASAVNKTRKKKGETKKG